MNKNIIIWVFFLFININCWTSKDSNQDSISENIVENNDLETDTIKEKNISLQEIHDAEEVEIDVFHTNLADLLSGKRNNYFDTIIKIDYDFWKGFSEDIDKDFNNIKEKRLSRILEWSKESFINKDLDTALLFYPFSGPDFLHAYYLYPNANEYLLLALEDVGSIPNLNKIGGLGLEKYIENVNLFLRDIYLRSYFITKHMKLDIKKEEKISGVLPSLYWFLSRTDHQIVDVEFFTVGNDGNLSFSDFDLESTNDGVRFHFVKQGSDKIKKLTYLSCDISDDGFIEENPGLLIYLNSLRSCNTFVKSASYLMHYRSFETIRTLILDKSVTLFQDDTGIPYKYVNNENWTVKCYGKYVKPIKDFEKNHDILYQKDLEVRYKKGSTKLPFSLGYHWRDASEQNQMLMIRN
tara:strand:- start:6616 stop:7842 length:1227 start_codon:yes stop_codon:yes gene_type:complete